MKAQLISIVAAVLVVGCGPSVDIWTAVEAGNIEAVKQAIADGADVNAKMDGWTPLHYATGMGLKEIAELLITAGADVNAKNEWGGTPLDEAKHKPETADLLRKHGGKTGEELKK